MLLLLAIAFLVIFFLAVALHDAHLELKELQPPYLDFSTIGSVLDNASARPTAIFPEAVVPTDKSGKAVQEVYRGVAALIYVMQILSLDKAASEAALLKLFGEADDPTLKQLDVALLEVLDVTTAVNLDLCRYVANERPMLAKDMRITAKDTRITAEDQKPEPPQLVRIAPSSGMVS